MPYNVYAIRLSDTDKRIKNKLNRRSSLPMGAYILNTTLVSAIDKKAYEKPKKSRDEGEVVFSGLILPSDLSLEDYQKFAAGVQTLPITLNQMFSNIPRIANWKNHYFVEDNTVITDLLLENDRHIKSLEMEQYGKHDAQQNYRLYHTYVLTLPVANHHFPKQLGITREDLLPILYGVVFELIHQHFLSKGLAVLFGFHLSPEDGKVHVHLQVPARTFNYFYQTKSTPFYEGAFIAWLNRKMFYSTKVSMDKRFDKMQKYEALYASSKNEKDYVKYLSWNDKYEDAKTTLDEISRIVGAGLRSGPVYESLKLKYLKLKQNNVLNSKDKQSLFTRNKGSVEHHHDTFKFMDEFKETYSNLLNAFLQNSKILKEGERLYTFVPSSPNSFTVKDMLNWGLTVFERERLNKKISEIFKMDTQFYQKKFAWNKNENVTKNMHLIVHSFKRNLKDEFNKNKYGFAQDYAKAEVWVNQWVDKLKDLQNNFTGFLDSLVDPTIFNANWKTLIKHKMNLFWERLETAPIIPIGYEVIEVDYHLDPEKEKELTYTMVDEMSLDPKSESDSETPIVREENVAKKIVDKPKPIRIIKTKEMQEVEDINFHLGSKAIVNATTKMRDKLWYSGMTPAEIEKDQAYEILEQINDPELGEDYAKLGRVGFDNIRSMNHSQQSTFNKLMSSYYKMLLDHSVVFDVESQFFTLKLDNYSVGFNPYDLSDLLENYYVVGENTLEEAYDQMLRDRSNEYER